MERVVNSILLLVSGTSLLLRLVPGGGIAFWDWCYACGQRCLPLLWSFGFFFSDSPLSASPSKADARELRFWNDAREVHGSFSPLHAEFSRRAS